MSEKKKSRAQVIKKRFFSLSLKIGLTLISLLVLLSILISIPAVQIKIVRKITEPVLQKIGHNMTLDYVNIRWFDTILLNNIKIRDTKNHIMISIDRLILDFKLAELLTDNSINFDKAIVQGVNVEMLNNAPDNRFNLNHFIDELKIALAPEVPSPNPRVFKTDVIVISNGRFKMYRNDVEPITTRFDQNHFTMLNVDARLKGFVLVPGVIEFKIESMQCLDSATQLQVRDLVTNYKNTRQSMVFQNMELSAGNSMIKQSMVFDFKQPSSLRYFIDSVKLTVNVKESLIYSRDLGLFAPSVRQYSDYYRLTGFLEGPVNRFNAQDITLEFGHNSMLRGYISMNGLPDLAETFIDARIMEGRVQAFDLGPYMSNAALQNIMKFGTVHLAGVFSGFRGDFVSNAAFDTNLGSFITDINLKLGTNPAEPPSYSGRLETHSFDLGRLLSDTLLYQRIDMTGSIRGSGFTRENARFNLISEISRIGINGYDYININTNAAMADGFFNGNLVIDDPSLEFNGNLSLDLNSTPEIIKIRADLGYASLDTLKITKKPATLSSSLNVDMRGLSLDEITGSLFFENTNFSFGEKEIFLDTLSLTSEKDSLGRALRIESQLADMAMTGNFDYSVLFKDAVDLFREYSLLFRNDSKELAEFHKSRKNIEAPTYAVDFSINPKGINGLLDLFDVNITTSSDTRLAGTIEGGRKRKFELSAEMSQFGIGGINFLRNTIQIESEKNIDTTLVFAKYRVRSEEQHTGEKPAFQNLGFDASWNGNIIDLGLRISQINTTNYLSTSANVLFLKDKTQIHFKPTELSLIEKIWQISANNLIILENDQYSVNNFSLYHNDQKINFNGVLSSDPDENLFISIVNFDFENLNPLITKKLDGVLNGFIDLKDFFGERKINSRLNLRDFKINNFLVGDVIAYSEYNNVQKDFDVNLDVISNGQQTMLINGRFDPLNQKEQLDLKATFTSANLNLIQPFYEDFISDVGGQLDGEVTITGRLKQPVINGRGSAKGEFTFDYLQTHYKLDGEVAFDEHSIQFIDFKLQDHRDNKGIIGGAITHNGFKELSYDLRGSMTDFLVLNTTAKDNSLYYGTAYATGDIRIFGKEKVLNIDAVATSRPGTRFFIPLDGGEEVVREDFINFISVHDTVAIQKRSESEKVKLSGINLNLDFDITRDAYCEIIFDVTAGDIIRGRGNGKINLQIDTKGDFNMYGDYTIEEGWYNFTLYNIINKEFQIEPSSKISWIGDPYEAILDIKANYEQLASLTPILRATQEDIDLNPELSRKYPAKVLLDIKGNLIAPEIGFGIDIEDYPKNADYKGASFETHITAFRNKLATDEQELKRQVFSLIILKNFSSENAFNVGGSVEKSVSEFISNQISYWVTQFDENLVVDVDLGTLDDEAFNTFQLRMSYSFLDGRLRVTRDGGFSDAATGTNVASVLGDWSVEYLLTNDGKLRAKIYNRTNYNTLNPELKSASTTAGFSILHTTSFDKIKEIFKKARDQNRPPPENDADPTPSISEPVSKQ